MSDLLLCSNYISKSSVLIFLLLIWFDIPAGKADKDIPAGRTWMKKHGIRWDCGDYMVAVVMALA